MPPTYRVKHDDLVEAIQWNGANLTEVQAFMAPDSPLLALGKIGASGNLGLYVHTGRPHLEHELSWAKRGDYIVRLETGFRVYDAEVFEKQFEALVSDPDLAAIDAAMAPPTEVMEPLL